jgi:molecular chaperone HscB
VNLQSSDFELFGLVPRFAQDRSALDVRWKELQREVHPDRFVAQGASAQRVAMQWSARINEAYKRLKDPLKRASYLCELNGAAIKAEDNTAMPAAFLMQQMEWREALDDAESETELEKIASEVNKNRRDSLQKCEHFLDVAHDYPAAVAQVRALMFIERFSRDIENRFEKLGS